MNITEALTENQKTLEKGITTADISDTAGSSTLRPVLDLSPFILDISRRPTPAVDMFLPSAQTGEGEARVFNKYQTKGTAPINPRDAVYGDGNLPEEETSVYGQTTAIYRSLGYSGSVTGLAKAQGRAVIGLLQKEIDSKAGLLKEALEWLFFWGSTTTLSPTTNLAQFAGLDELVTNEVDAGGARLTGTAGKSIIDQAANLIGQQGGFATHMFAPFRTAQNINNTYNNNQSLQVIKTGGDDSNITWGEIVPEVRTSAGTWKIVPDFFLNPGNTFTLPNGSQSTPSGANTATVFIVPDIYVNFVNLLSMTMEPLGRRTDKEEFMVKIYTTLINEAVEWCVKITNVDDTLP
jgi:hypothetical protein